MDLCTIERSMCAAKYESAEALATDVRLVWSNCCLYNGDSSPLGQWALKLQGHFETQLKSAAPPASELEQMQTQLKRMKVEVGRGASVGSEPFGTGGCVWRVPTPRSHCPTHLTL